MELNYKAASGKVSSLICYRIKKHKKAAALSIVFAIFFSCILYYFAGKAYPDFKPFDKMLNNILSLFGEKHNQRYTFYSGEPGSAYYQIGEGIDIARFSDGDSIKNQSSDGGYDNALKVSKDDKAFALVPKLVIDGEDDQVRRSIQIVTPLFTERVHIFYRKSLFPKLNTADGNEVQLSANTDTSILRNFSQSVKNIYVSHAGNSTFILSSYVLALLSRQIRENFNSSKNIAIPNFRKIHIPFNEACKRMLQNNLSRDSIIDIMFWVSPDPTDNFKKILDSNEYGLMSVDPSFVAALNKEYHLNLEVTNIPKEYYSNGKANDVSTISTMAYLIASREMPQDDILSMVQTIDDDKKEINRSIIHTDSNSDSMKLLEEFGFCRFFKNNYKDSMGLQWKDWIGMISFIIAMITFFFPLLKSINSIKSTLSSWYLNKQIDVYLLPGNPANNKENFEKLNVRIADLYGDCALSEAHYNALAKRISMHLSENSASVIKVITREDKQSDDKKMLSVH